MKLGGGLIQKNTYEGFYRVIKMSQALWIFTGQNKG